MAKKKKAARSAPSRGYSKKRVSRPQRHNFFSEFSDRNPTLSRPFDQVAQASIEKNREVLRALAKY